MGAGPDSYVPPLGGTQETHKVHEKITGMYACMYAI